MFQSYPLLLYFILTNWYVLKISACKPKPVPSPPPTTPPPPPPPPACSLGETIKDYLDVSTLAGNKEESHQIPDTVVVEVLVAVDYPLFQKIGNFYKDGVWRTNPTKPKAKDKKAEVILYVRKFMSAVDIKFQRHFTKPRITFSIAKVLVGEPLPFIVNRKAFDIYLTQQRMKEFFRNQTLKTSFPFDVALLLTGEEIFKEEGGLDVKYGLSEIGSACDYEWVNGGQNINHANIIVQDLGQFSGVKTATHQFGHLLGSYADGELSSVACCSKEGYIMSNNVYDQSNIDRAFKDKRNAFKWSNCSKEVISKFVRKATCLFNTPNEDPYPLFKWEELATGSQVPFLSQQCVIYAPKKEHVDLVDFKGYDCGADPCQYLECRTYLEQVTADHHWSDCKVHERQHAMEGSVCGEKKNCFQGNCIAGKKA